MTDDQLIIGLLLSFSLLCIGVLAFSWLDAIFFRDGRGDTMNEIISWIDEDGVLKRGRLGAFKESWVKYEVGLVMLEGRKVHAVTASYTDPKGDERAIACQIVKPTEDSAGVSEEYARVLALGKLKIDYAHLHSKGQLP